MDPREHLVLEGLYEQSFTIKMSDVEAETQWQLHQLRGQTFDAACDALVSAHGYDKSALSDEQKADLVAEVEDLDVGDPDCAASGGHVAIVFDGKKCWQKINDESKEQDKDAVAEIKEDLYNGRVEALVPLLELSLIDGGADAKHALVRGFQRDLGLDGGLGLRDHTSGNEQCRQPHKALNS
jgi:hypothetical protein